MDRFLLHNLRWDIAPNGYFAVNPVPDKKSGWMCLEDPLGRIDGHSGSYLQNHRASHTVVMGYETLRYFARRPLAILSSCNACFSPFTI